MIFTFKSVQAAGGALVLFGALALSTGSARADVSIYQATTYENNGLNFGPDGTSNPPPFDPWEMGNTITFAGTERDLQTVSLLVYGGEFVNYPIVMDIYSGNNPNTGALLGSATAPAGYGTNDAIFDFGNLTVPNTVTFIVSLPDANSYSYDSLFLYPVLTSHAAPTVGSGDNSLWYGTGPGTFIQNDTYATSDGAGTNYLNAQFNATSATPEPGFYGVLALGFTGGLVALRRRKVQAVR